MIRFSKYFMSGTMLSVCFGVVLASYLIMEMQTNEKLINLNFKLRSIQKEIFTRQGVLSRMTHFNGDVRDYAKLDEGAYIAAFYGTVPSDSSSKWLKIFLSALGIRSSPACYVLSPKLEAKSSFIFKGDKAGFLIRFVAPVAIRSIKYEHLIEDLSQPDTLSACPKTLKFYGMRNSTQEAVELGTSALILNKREQHQKAELTLLPSEYFQYFRFDIVSNHGNPDHTIVYKLSVFAHRKPHH